MRCVKPTPLLRFDGVGGFRTIFVKDESYHPNGTFKDRLSRKALERYPKNTTFGVISYGNTAISLARHIIDLDSNNQAVIFVPEEFETWTFGPSSMGSILPAKEILKELKLFANVIPINLSSQILNDDDLRNIAVEHGLAITNFVNITEGLDIPAYADVIKEVVMQLGRVPDVCVVPYGAGILSNEIKDYLECLGHGVVIPVSVASPSSLARMLYGPVWVDTTELKQAGVAYSRHKTPDRTGSVRQPYPVFLVQEKEILQGLEIAKSFGLSSEPSGSAGFGILPRLHELYPYLQPEQDLIVVINTGNGIDGFLKKRGNNDNPL